MYVGISEWSGRSPGYKKFPGIGSWAKKYFGNRYAQGESSKYASYVEELRRTQRGDQKSKDEE
jgi:hypothetical protein